MLETYLLRCWTSRYIEHIWLSLLTLWLKYSARLFFSSSIQSYNDSMKCLIEKKNLKPSNVGKCLTSAFWSPCTERCNIAITLLSWFDRRVTINQLPSFVSGLSPGSLLFVWQYCWISFNQQTLCVELADVKAGLWMEHKKRYRQNRFDEGRDMRTLFWRNNRHAACLVTTKSKSYRFVWWKYKKKQVEST